MAGQVFKFEVQKHHVGGFVSFELVCGRSFDHAKADLLF